jgi:hypothetical protein
MDLTTCSVCVLAASAGSAMGSFLAAGRCGRSRGRRALRGSRTMRAWPGGSRTDAQAPGGTGPPRHSRRGVGRGEEPPEGDGVPGG